MSPRHRHFFSVFLLVLLPLVSTVSAAHLVTEHYDITADKVDIQDVARLLEAFYPQAQRFFHAAPPAGQLLKVEILADARSFHAALKVDHQAAENAGGYYAPDTRKAYLYVQPSEYFTRQLLLHECTHQFHYLSACGNRRVLSTAYVEGVAEYLGMHDWDGKTLRTGVIPTLSLEDYPAAALSHFRDNLHGDFAGLATGKLNAQRPESWALIHFLVDAHRGEYERWATLLNQHTPAEKAWSDVFGHAAPELAGEYLSWIKSHQQPWQIITTSWQQRGQAIQGYTRDQAVGIALPKLQPTSLRFRLDPQERPWMGGLVFGYTSRDQYSLFQLSSGRNLRILRRSDGKWKTEGSWTLHAGPDGDVLEARLNGDTVVLLANGGTFATLKSPGQLGLHIQEGRINFYPQAR